MREFQRASSDRWTQSPDFRGDDNRPATILDICLNFQNISGTHCELSLKSGVWHLRDLGSTNGVKVNGERTLRRPLRPGDEIGIANHRYTIQYLLPSGSTFEDVFAEEEDVFGQSLLEKAGLEKPKRPSEGKSRR